MSVEIRVPQLPESVADATLVAWRRKAGEAVSRDENLADLETDKVVLEVPAPVGGVLQEIRIAEGTTVKSGELLALIAPGAGAAPGPAAAGPAAPGPAAIPAASASRSAPQEPKLGPAAQRVAEELGLPRETIAAAAKGGRVSKSDLVAAAGSPPAAKPAGAAPPAVSKPTDSPMVPAGKRGAPPGPPAAMTPPPPPIVVPPRGAAPAPGPPAPLNSNS